MGSKIPVRKKYFKPDLRQSAHINTFNRRLIRAGGWTNERLTSVISVNQPSCSVGYFCVLTFVYLTYFSQINVLINTVISVFQSK